MDANDNIGPHLFGNVDGNVVEQSAIGVDVIPRPDRCKDARERHRRSQCQRQRAIVEYVRLARNKIGRHTGKRNGEIVEALEFGIRKGNPVKDQSDLLTGIEAPGKLQALAQAEFKAVRYFMSVLFASKGEVLERCLASQYVIPVDPIGDLLDLRGRSSSSVYTSD